jgi:chorismate mutase / prephenate dehydratase
VDLDSTAAKLAAMSSSEHSPQSDGPLLSLEQLRESIDSTDREILRLINRRAGLAQAVGELKKHTDAPIYRPEREAQIHTALAANNPGPLSNAAVHAVWNELISGCRELERRMRVAYLGPKGTFSEQAAFLQFGSQIECQPQPSFDDVFRAVEAGSADFGVVPVENSSEGAISRTLDLLLNSTLKISAEVSLRVKQHLLTKSGNMSGVTKICAHAQSLAQCQHYLNKHYPGLERIAVSSNAQGALLAASDLNVAALAGEAAAREFGLGVVASAIQDDPHNRTRFVVIGRLACLPSGADNTSIILSVPNRAGAMHSLIEPLARHGVSMSRFESRPARQGGWEYFFYIDLQGHQDEPAVAAALEEIRQQAAYFKVTGSYPRARD